jgi:hypothetical protein
MDKNERAEATVSLLKRAALVEEFSDTDGNASIRLTPTGARVGRSFEVDDDAAAVLDALLDYQGAPREDGLRLSPWVAPWSGRPH